MVYDENSNAFFFRKWNTEVVFYLYCLDSNIISFWNHKLFLYFHFPLRLEFKPLKISLKYNAILRCIAPFELNIYVYSLFLW